MNETHEKIKAGLFWSLLLGAGFVVIPGSVAFVGGLLLVLAGVFLVLILIGGFSA